MQKGEKKKHLQKPVFETTPEGMYSTVLLMHSTGKAAFTASDQQIVGHPGMSVTLTFQVPTGTKSVWLKRLPNEKYISYCQDLTPTRPSDQEESFKGRVEGMDCSNIRGTVSVTLKNLTRNDSGTYELQVVDHGRQLFNKTVFLNVTDPGQPGRHTEDGGKEAESVGLTVGVGSLLIFVVLAGIIYKFVTCKEKNSHDLPPDQDV
ncbi:uncharacterized protein LOC109199325 isoform X1 [Oreochromis niloticus]|uniref:uncharacterized protein LOC109199325 isoform X1 n=1 Tax=Oreochromis niloticus TaxID=8128 RepID=UPI000905C2E6|nr:uncharacterized protein LOC109199325 isoform X1 [Oreochromis niloticus]CAI5660785.1 unnamed protein product [Mustela putorius furo]